MAEQATSSTDLETWENISRSRFFIKKYNNRGDLINTEVQGRRKFHVTPQERAVNQELMASERKDPFLNGMFAPVRLLDTTEDAEEIASNPNVIGESEMVNLVKGSAKALKERIGSITNHVLLARLLEVASEQDVQASKITAIQERLDEVNPSRTNVVEHADPTR